jgi:integrase
MPRIVKFKPGLRKARKRAGLSPWAVNVPDFLSATGKRQELFFATQAEAQAECDRLKARKENFGTSLSNLSAIEIAEAAKSIELLRPHGVGLLEAVNEYLAIHNQRTASLPFVDLCNLYLTAKAGKNPRHLKGLRNTRDRFPSLHSMLVSDIDQRILEPLINAVPPGGRNLILRHFKSFFNYAIKKGYAVSNPVDGLDPVEVKRKEVEIIEPKAVARMLRHALSDDLQLVPFTAIGFFAGIRPEELTELDWKDVDLAAKEITVPAEVSKTNTRRFPTLSDNAVAWLQAYIRAGGKTEGKLVNLKEDALYAHRQKNRAAAGITRWPQDAMRHSFASFWLAKHKDVNRLRELMGHEGNTATLWRHYYRGATEAEAEKFWSIMPPAVAPNVIDFSAKVG